MAASLAVACNISAAPSRWRQKEFIITFWFPPPVTDQMLARVKSEGFNLTWAKTAEELDVVGRHQLRGMIYSELIQPAVLDDPVKRAQLDALIERVKNHPALEAYYIWDEPGAGEFARLGRLVAYLRERDPLHLTYINLFPTYANEQQLGVSADAAERARVGYPTNFAGVGADDKMVLRYREHVKRFVETVKPDLLSYDHYHFLLPDKDGKPVDGQQYFLNLALIRLAALEANVPFVNTIQAGTNLPSWRLPSASEMRWLVYTTLAYGGRGINYFTYWEFHGGLYVGGKASPLVTPVAALNAEMAKFGPALLELKSLGVYHTGKLPYGTETVPADAPVQIKGDGEFVLGLFGDEPTPKSRQRRSARKDVSPTAFMIVNRDYAKEATAELEIGWKGKVQELDRQTGKWVPAQIKRGERRMQVKLMAGDGRLFRVKM